MVDTKPGTRARREELFEETASSLFHDLIEKERAFQRYSAAFNKRRPYLARLQSMPVVLRLGRIALDKIGSKVGFCPIIPLDVSQNIDQYFEALKLIKNDIESARRSLATYGRDKPGLHQFDFLYYRQFPHSGEKPFRLAFTINPFAFNRTERVSTEGFFPELKYQTWDQTNTAVNIPAKEGSAPIILIPERSGLRLKKQTVYPMGSLDPEEWESCVFKPQSTLEPTLLNPAEF